MTTTGAVKLPLTAAPSTDTDSPGTGGVLTGGRGSLSAAQSNATHVAAMSPVVPASVAVFSDQGMLMR